MSNLISDRVSYFLKDVPPFSQLTHEERDQIAQKITVKYFESDEVIFAEGEDQSGFCYVLNQGNIKLSKREGNGDFLVDQCEPGDVFGVRSIITGNPYSMTAQCVEESLVYAIPKNLFESLFQSNTEFSNFFASGYAAGQVIVRSDQENTRRKEYQPSGEALEYSKEVVTCNLDESIEQAAKTMSEFRVGSIIVVDKQSHPIGIVTDTDLRNKVLAAGHDPKKPIGDIMSSPVKTIKQTITLSETLMEMIRSGVHHLVVTEDGSPNSKLCGIVSDHDVVLAQQNHPASLVKSIKRSDDPNVWKAMRDKAETLLKDYLTQGIEISLVASLITKINDTIIEKALQKALKEHPEATKISFCWLSLGSEGREEQLLRTDQDNAMVFADSANNEVNQATLLKVAESVNEMLMTCGFEKCPADIMAKNPMYCQPLSKWKEYFSKWIHSPDPKSVMNATIFFDFRISYGDHELAKQLEDHLIDSIKERDLFLNFLAQNALQNPPPLSFFKNFLVESSGEHKDEFDIKKRGMMPLSDAARLLLLNHHVSGIQNTSERYRKLSELEPKNISLFESCGDAYELFMKHRALNGLANKDSGRFIALNELNKLEKQVLKNAFLSIKDIQDLIRVRFQQSYFS